MNVWIGTSWKMNKTLKQAMDFANALASADGMHDPRIQRFVIPPFTSVRDVKKVLENTSVKVGAQNMHWADDGAWTGEVSPLMLKDCNLDLVELGHSERREFFGETDEAVGLKVEAAVRHGLTPLICIGETLAQRQAGEARTVLEAQVRGALSKLSPSPLLDADQQILFAYEPVWAIGVNGVPATSEYADQRHAEIIAVCETVLGRRVPCLYGGSVNAGNCEELVARPHIDGLFIGRAAWTVEGYLEILNKCAAKL